jgi:hypothetical protein
MKHTVFATLALGVLTVGCGGSDGATKDASAGGGGESAAASAAGASSAGVSGSGGRTGGGAGSSAAGSSAAGSSTAGGASSGDCELDDAIVSCYVEAGQGSAVCTETALEGTGAQVVRDQCGGTVSEGEHCPTNATLAGYCKGGVTTYYYEGTPGQLWANIGASCEATSGTWCGR